MSTCIANVDFNATVRKPVCPWSWLDGQRSSKTIHSGTCAVQCTTVVNHYSIVTMIYCHYQHMSMSQNRGLYIFYLWFQNHHFPYEHFGGPANLLQFGQPLSSNDWPLPKSSNPKGAKLPCESMSWPILRVFTFSARMKEMLAAVKMPTSQKVRREYLEVGEKPWQTDSSQRLGVKIQPTSPPHRLGGGFQSNLQSQGQTTRFFAVKKYLYYIYLIFGHVGSFCGQHIPASGFTRIKHFNFKWSLVDF